MSMIHNGANTFLGFVHPIFGFWSLLVTKIQKYCVFFVYILQGKTEKKTERKSRNESDQNTEKQKYGMNKTPKSNLQFSRIPIF